MANSTVIAIPSQYVVITTIVYVLLSPIFFQPDNAFGEGDDFVVNNDKTMMYGQQAIEVETKECKSPCLLVQKCA